MRSSEVNRANRTYHEAQSYMELLPNYFAWTYGSFRPYLKGAVIELGCGAGLGIATYVDRVSQIVAVDHDKNLLSRLKASYRTDRVQVILADLSGDWSELNGLSANVVLLMDVLEHFEDDLEFLRRAAALLKSGGHILIKVPGQACLYSAMDRASGHFRRYDPGDLEALASKLRLRVVKLKQINRLGSLGYRLRHQRAINFSRSFSHSQLKIINLAMPLVRLFDMLPGPSGLSLVAVLEKDP